jgi:anti-sigma factor ChrR (cupin superfamily)
LLLQCQVRGTTDVLTLQEDVILAQEAAIAAEAARATAIHAMVASAQEAAVAWERATVIVQEAEAQTTLAEREARETVSKWRWRVSLR